jgi:hypothetical protein
MDADDDFAGRAVVCPDCQAGVRTSSGDERKAWFTTEDRAEWSRRPDPTPRDSFVVRLIVGCLMVMVPLPIAWLLGQPWLCHVTTVSALLLGMVGWTWLLLTAFGNSVWQGLLVLFVPCAVFVPALTNWREAKRPFLLTLAAVVVQVVNVAVQLAFV